MADTVEIERGTDRRAADTKRAAQRIHDAAKELFYRQGIRATGVEEVCRAASATKMSLYRAYPSKDALVAAILDEDAAEYEVWFRGVVDGAATPAGRLDALIDAMAAELREPDRCGCPMLLAQAEFREPGHPTHRVVARHKSRMRALFAEVAAAAGAADPEALGDALAMIMDGAWAALPYMGGERASEIMQAAARRMIAAAV